MPSDDHESDKEDRRQVTVCFSPATRAGVGSNLAVSAACCVSLLLIALRDKANSSSSEAASAWSAGLVLISLAAQLGAARSMGRSGDRLITIHELVVRTAGWSGVGLLAIGAAWQNHAYKGAGPMAMCWPASMLFLFALIREGVVMRHVFVRSTALVELAGNLLVGFLVLRAAYLATLSISEGAKNEDGPWLLGSLAVALLGAWVRGRLEKRGKRIAGMSAADAWHACLALSLVSLGKAASSRCGVCGGSGKLSIDLSQY
jgi:hypothetical protein